MGNLVGFIVRLGEYELTVGVIVGIGTLKNSIREGSLNPLPEISNVPPPATLVPC